MARSIKRIVDVLMAAVLLVLLLPLAFLVAFLVWFRLGRPLFFRQVRIGAQERLFSIWKFRTMTDVTDAEGNLLPSRERLTALGSALRASSVDEVPQLWNVLRGDLSFVGPRPLLPEYLPLYSERHRRRHEVPPGITGWAQVHGRSALSWSERFDFDIWYVENWSLALDLKILVKTIGIVLSRRGSQPRDGKVMKRFQGYSCDDDPS